ncbi:MAG: leucyl/phenylalanyl-tRNA--protein transferase [Acidobacteriota bacterium]
MDPQIVFPNPRHADEYGLVAVGGDFRPQMLIAAYAAGIFPWPTDEFPYAWFSPDPRMILLPSDFHRSRSLRKTLRRGRFRTTFDTAFERVIGHCAEVPRANDGATWIADELRYGFIELHRLGLAHSVEVWRGDDLVGGLYGTSLGAMFGGESMFSLEPDASKIALSALVDLCQAWDLRFIDCQVHSDHLESLGAEEWPRDVFLDELAEALEAPTRLGAWTGAPELSPAPEAPPPGDPGV